MKSVNSDVAYEFIRERILSGEYPPGYSLMTEHLSALIGVSRTPVRDALRQLETDGLVVILPRQGASVRKADLAEFIELCDMRLALEVHAAGLAASNRTPLELAEMKHALETMRGLMERIASLPSEAPLMADLVNADIRFHVAVMTAAHNKLMKKQILRLHLINRVVIGGGEESASDWEPSGKQERDAHRRDVMECHDEIFKAIENSDVPAAKAAMEHHIQDIITRRVGSVAAENGMLARTLTPEEMTYTA